MLPRRATGLTHPQLKSVRRSLMTLASWVLAQEEKPLLVIVKHGSKVVPRARVLHWEQIRESLLRCSQDNRLNRSLRQAKASLLFRLSFNRRYLVLLQSTTVI